VLRQRQQHPVSGQLPSVLCVPQAALRQSQVSEGGLRRAVATWLWVGRWCEQASAPSTAMPLPHPQVTQQPAGGPWPPAAHPAAGRTDSTKVISADRITAGKRPKMRLRSLQKGSQFSIVMHT
jgi:hypothetical protein